LEEGTTRGEEPHADVPNQSVEKSMQKISYFFEETGTKRRNQGENKCQLLVSENIGGLLLESTGKRGGKKRAWAGRQASEACLIL